MFNHSNRFSQLWGKESNPPYLIWIILGVLVIAFIPLIIFKLSPLKDEDRCTLTVNAVVTENITKLVRSGNNGGEHIAYFPVYQYDFNGQTYTVRSHVYSDEPKYPVNTSVQLKIDPDDPTYFYSPFDEETEEETNYFFVVFGLVFLIMAGSMFWIAKTRLIPFIEMNQEWKQ